MSDKNTIGNCEICGVRWKGFDTLTKSEFQLINENRYEATFKPGEILLKQDSPASNALFLATGMVKSYIEGPKGRNFIMGILRPGMLIMGPGAYVNLRYTYSVSALTSVQACFINFNIISQIVRTNGRFAEKLIEDISEKALRSHLRMVNLAQKRMPGRVADSLIYFSEEIFKSDTFEMILSRQELGDFTNMAKESVVRILKEFESSEIISINQSTINILNKEKLVQVSRKG